MNFKFELRQYISDDGSFQVIESTFCFRVLWCTHNHVLQEVLINTVPKATKMSLLWKHQNEISFLNSVNWFGFKSWFFAIGRKKSYVSYVCPLFNGGNNLMHSISWQFWLLQELLLYVYSLCNDLILINL